MFQKWRLKRLQIKEAELKMEIGCAFIIHGSADAFLFLDYSGAFTKLAKIQMKIKFLEEKIYEYV